MKAAIVLAGVAALIAGRASAQVIAVQVRNGDVYVEQAQGWGRLTRDGHVSEATVSRDRNLIAYLRGGGNAGTSDALNDIFLCSAPHQTCVLLVRGAGGTTNENNLAGINTLAFSLQAGEKPDGTLVGSLFFLSMAGGANTDSLHRVLLGGKTIHQVVNSPAPFVTYANSLEIIPTGKYAGALNIEIQEYTSHGACGAKTIFDPNTKKVLQQGPANDC